MKKKKYDPHHYTSAIVIALGVLIIAFFIFGPNAKATQAVVLDTPINCNNLPDFGNIAAIGFYQIIDSDNDGLSDFDECIFGSNPTEADSDGDHIPDGKEYDEGTDLLRS
jgi:hypothetical protein